ncbi:spore coat polysaccharide biosynthesis protein spsC [Candidatus Omnitrophus magneticus]|uniref:Spore coat polysaccharide biosynthesis protein spsC n=1 Tax=Candidatus Omnitrophus magneticus TaxID=1609969 RepID=A0A0F0CS08_9BACT|nr:spore coat polysaccharide biosynthesis protein spsC [Candidatus Omnitrophus magneticus]
MTGKLALFGGEKIRNKSFVTCALIDEEERKRVEEVLSSGVLSGFIAKAGDAFLGGRQVKELESEIKKYFGTKYAIALNSATSALHAGLLAVGIGPGDEVIVPPYTMSASATAIIMSNAIPVFADIEEETFCIDPKDIRKKITDKTRAIMVVHLFGGTARMDEIMRIAREYNLKVIEDTSQAPGAVYKEKLAGTIGDIGVFSLNQHKTITSGEGGFAITNDENLALRIQLIRNHGEVVADGMGVSDVSNIVGFNYRMTELEGAVSVGQFKRLDKLNEHRINLARYLAKKISKFKGLMLPKEIFGKHVYFVFPIIFKEDIVGVTRDLFVKALNAEGIPFGAGYVRPIYLEPMYQKKIAYGKDGWPFSACKNQASINYSKGICPVTEKMHEKELIMTGVIRYPHSEEDMDDVAKAFTKIFDNISELKK